MNRVLPRLAVHALRRTAHPMLVATRRGTVLHLLDAGCCHSQHSLTPTGRVRRHLRPLCGQHARVWYFQDQPTRPLCSTCTRIAGQHERATDWRRLDVLDVLRACAMARTPTEAQAASRALCEAGLAGDLRLRRALLALRGRLRTPAPHSSRHASPYAA